MDIEQLAHEVAALKQRVEQLEAENGALGSKLRAVEPSAAERLTRRGVLRRSAEVVGAGVAITAAGGLLGARPAQAAAGGSMILGGNNTSGASATFLTSTSTAYTLTVNNTATGRGLRTFASQNEALYAKSSGAGMASIRAEKTSAGQAVYARIDNDASESEVVIASTSGSGAAVLGTSSKGRGGVFSGQRAAVRLVMGGLSNHPSSGTTGDIYLDNAKRLWLCRGGTDWVKIV